MRRLRSISLVLALFACGAAPSPGAIPDPIASLAPDVQAYYRTVDAKVGQRGWSCVFAGDKVKPAASFAYTVGLSGKHLPELLLNTGEDGNVQCALLNAVAKRMIAHGVPIADGFEPLGPHKIRLNAITPADFFGKCTLANIWRQAHGITEASGMQIVFADKKGAYPN